MVGVSVGEVDGLDEVGELVGDTVGCETVGDSVGDRVGASVHPIHVNKQAWRN